MFLILESRPNQATLETASKILKKRGFEPHNSRCPNEPAYFKEKAGIQFNGLELQVELNSLPIEEAQTILDSLIIITQPVSYYSLSDDMDRFIEEDPKTKPECGNECSRYSFGDLPYHTRE